MDAEFIIDLVNSDGWLKFIGDRKVSNINDAENYIQKILDNPSYYYSVFELKNSGKAIGIVTFLNRENQNFPDIGFALLPEFEKNGYTIEASKAYLDEIIKSKTYKNIIAITIFNNYKSISLLTKLGFKHEYNYDQDNQFLSLFKNNTTTCMF